MKDRMSNCEKMAGNAVCDGLKMLWRGIDEDQYQERLGIIRNLLYGYVGLNGQQVSKGLKHKVLRSAAEHGDALYSVQLTGEAARVTDALPWWMLRTATKVHMKTFADEAYQGAADAFAEACFKSEGYLQASFFANAKNDRSSKNSGTKGTRLGSRKADFQGVVYGRQRERVGIEARTEDDACRKVVKSVEETSDAMTNPLADDEKARLLQNKCARLGFNKLLRECRQRGINIAEFFTLVTPFAVGAVTPESSDELSSKEEQSYLPPA
jgi:hypothetical protein